MSKKSNPTLIGGFVVGAVVLFAVGVAVFGGSELFKERQAYVAYFVENTGGLRVGSNAVVNGVRVGEVESISLLVNERTFEYMTEVIIEITPDSFISTRDGVKLSREAAEHADVDQLVDEAGLRATLDVESFITGQLMIEFVLRPDTPAVHRGGGDLGFPEIPTIPSRAQEILTKVQETIATLSDSFDIDEISERISGILDGTEELVNSPDVRESLSGINTIINKEDTQELTTSLRAALDEVRVAASDASSLIRNADGKVDELQPAIENLAGALDELQGALGAAKATLQGESAEGHQLTVALSEIERAARSLREFLDYLERHPEALLRGKN